MIERDIYAETFLVDLIKSNLFTCHLEAYPYSGNTKSFVQFKVSSLKPLLDAASKKKALRNFVLLVAEFADPRKFKQPILESFNALNN